MEYWSLIQGIDPDNLREGTDIYNRLFVGNDKYTIIMDNKWYTDAGYVRRQLRVNM